MSKGYTLYKNEVYNSNNKANKCSVREGVVMTRGYVLADLIDFKWIINDDVFFVDPRHEEEFIALFTSCSQIILL